MALTCPSGFRVDRLREHVRATYDRLARSPDGDFHFHRGPDYAMTRPRRDFVWWSWLLTELALGARLGGLEGGLAAAVAVTALSGVCLAWRARTAGALSVQVRAVYLGLLLLGAWPPLVALHWAQLAGTAILLVFDYCFLARALSLMPWNRRGKMTLERLRETFLSPPVRNVLAR